jgi:hypothetical protein
MLSVIESLLKHVEKVDRTLHQETRERTTHGFVRNTIALYQECYKRTHQSGRTARVPFQRPPIETSGWPPGLERSNRVTDTPLHSNSKRNPTEERTTRWTSNDRIAGWHSGAAECMNTSERDLLEPEWGFTEGT